MDRRSKNPRPKKSKTRAKRSYRTKARKPRDFREFHLLAPELRWVDAVLRSFQEEAPPTWVPFPYQAMLEKYGRKGRKSRVLH